LVFIIILKDTLRNALRENSTILRVVHWMYLAYAIHIARTLNLFILSSDIWL
jgi:hypothetical protein